jgi:hypothetical protein
MALDGEVEIFRGHAAAIVDDANEAPAAQFDRDVDAAGARVERILDELLDGGGRPFDDLAGRNAIDKNRIKTADGHGRVHQGGSSEFHTQIASDWMMRRVEFQESHSKGEINAETGVARLIRNFPANRG